MTDTIQQRLEMLQKGEIPDGYKKTKAGIMPLDWDGNVRAKHLFRNHTDKNHNGDLEILASTQEHGIMPRSQIGIDIKCSEEGILGYKKVSKGDFVISLRSFQGGIEYSEYDGIVSPAYTILKPIMEIVPDYYRNYFKTEAFIARLNGAVYGIRDGKQIGYEDFGDMFIHCPPVAEQERIAEILNQCDTVIELKKKRLEQERNKRTVLICKLLNRAQASVKSANGRYGTIGDLVLSIESGTSVKSAEEDVEYVPGKKFVLKTSSISGGLFLPEEVKEILEEEYSRATCQIESDTLLVSRMNTPKLVGACALCNLTLPNVFLPDRIWKVTLKDNVDPRWLNYILNSDDLQKAIQRKAGGTSNSMKNISQKDFLGIPIAIPSHSEQIISADIISAIDIVIRCLNEELKFWNNKKRALMQLLLSGVVRVNI